VTVAKGRAGATLTGSCVLAAIGVFGELDALGSAVSGQWSCWLDAFSLRSKWSRLVGGSAGGNDGYGEEPCHRRGKWRVLHCWRERAHEPVLTLKTKTSSWRHLFNKVDDKLHFFFCEQRQLMHHFEGSFETVCGEVFDAADNKRAR
jgi:hypothetical protein